MESATQLAICSEAWHVFTPWAGQLSTEIAVLLHAPDGKINEEVYGPESFATIPVEPVDFAIRTGPYCCCYE